MLNGAFPMKFVSLFFGALTLCIAPQAMAQSVEFQWQQTASNKNHQRSQFNQYALEGDFEAVLLGVEQRHYHTGASDEQRISNLRRLKLGVQYLTDIGEHYSLWPRLQILAGYDNHLSTDSLTYNPQLVGIRELTDTMSLAAGAGALLHTAQDQYYPVFGVVLNSTEQSRWSGNLTIPQANIAYRIDQTWFAQAGLNWQTRYYKTTEGSIDAAFMRTKDVLLSLGIKAELNQGVHISSQLTYAFERELRLYHSSTSRVTETPANGLGFRIIIGYHF